MHLDNFANVFSAPNRRRENVEFCRLHVVRFIFVVVIVSILLFLGAYYTQMLIKRTGAGSRSSEKNNSPEYYDVDDDDYAPYRSGKSNEIDEGANLRWNLRSARAAIPNDFKFDKFSNVVNYDFRNSQFDAYKEWRNASLDLGKSAVLVTKLLEFTHNELARSADGTLTSDGGLFCLSVAENFMRALFEKINGSAYKITAATLPNVAPLTRRPWGNNWYQFSVDVPAMCAYYLMLPRNKRRLTGEALTLILQLIESPTRSLGVDRGTANSLYMFGPWILANYFVGTQQRCVDNPSYRYVQEFSNLVEQSAPLRKGFHEDGTFVEHETVLGWGYLRNMSSYLTNYAYAFDGTIGTAKPKEKWDFVARLILHPTVDRGPPGMLNRDNSYKSFAYPTATLGIVAIPTARFLRYNTPQCRFVVRAVTAGLGYYESDTETNTGAQHWVQCRVPFTVNAPASVPTSYAEAFGLFAEHDGAQADHRKYVALPSPKNTTTHVKYPSTDSWSFVGAYENYGFSYQEYQIPEFGEFRVCELVVVDGWTSTVRCTTIIENRSASRSVFVNGSSDSINPFTDRLTTVYAVPPLKSETFETNVRMLDGMISMKPSAAETAATTTSLLPYTFTAAKLVNGDAATMSIDRDGVFWLNGVRKIDCMRKYASSSRFDATLNQYVF